MFFSTVPKVFWLQAFSIFILSLLIGIYPILAALKIKECKALHG
jgi:hypothetical protein